MRGALRQSARLARTSPLTLGYVGLLAGSGACLRLVDGQTRTAVLQSASTNLANLHQRKLHVLLTSAVVVAPPVGGSLVPGAVLLAAGEQLLGWRPTAGVFALGHTTATLLVSALLEAGRLPGVHTPSVSSAVDVGISYGVLAVLGAVTVAWPVRPWPPVGTAVVAASVPLLVATPTFTAWGHLFSVLVGIAAGAALRSQERATA